VVDDFITLTSQYFDLVSANVADDVAWTQPSVPRGRSVCGVKRICLLINFRKMLETLQILSYFIFNKKNTNDISK
jgi:hypothetical protein